VENAGWQLTLLIQNQGNVDDVLNRIFINGKLIDELGYNHGDTLPSKTMIATNLPDGGLSIPAGSQVNVYIWIGEESLSRGSQLTIELQKPNQLTLQRIIKLT